MIKIRKTTLLMMLILISLAFLYAYKSKTKLTYIEYVIQNEQSDDYMQLSNIGDQLVQEFTMPYDIIHGVAVKIGTFGRDNNSSWKIIINEKDSREIVYEDIFNASLISDCSYHLIEFNKNIRLKKNSIYELRIIADRVSQETALAFYYSKEPTTPGELYTNGMIVGGGLCFAIYGGDVDWWWLGYVLLVMLYGIIVILRGHKVISKGQKLVDDKFLMSFVIAGVTVLLLSSYSLSATFIDENDNIRGGMLIAKGAVLYKDYVTQHTPVAYYLCALFALLGAGSVEQFRLSYYIFEAIVWALLYHRHSDFFGKKKLAILAILEIILISSLISPQGNQILSDGIQGLCIVALLLEFLRYYQDRTLDWIRSIIVSSCVWGSFGAAFISAYALIWLFGGVVYVEIYSWVKKGFSFRKACFRYYKLLLSLSIPLIGTVMYFAMNNSLHTAFEQFYSFNREVYPKYVSGLGSNLLQPFINAIQYFFYIIANHFNIIIMANATNVTVLQLITIIFATIVLVILLTEKRFLESFILFMVMCCSATRGYGFHGLAAWYVAIMIIVIFLDKLLGVLPKVGIPVAGLLSIYLLSTYVGAVGNNLMYKQPSITPVESGVVSITEEKERILIDAFYCDSIYFLYKDRYPVNRTVYMLPWYMDWYEQDTIDDLCNNMPNVVVYNENQDTWGYMYYANAFATVLKQHYIQISENPDDRWGYGVWLRKK